MSLSRIPTFVRALRTLHQRRGSRYFVYLLRGYLWPRIFFRIRSLDKVRRIRNLILGGTAVSAAYLAFSSSIPVPPVRLGLIAILLLPAALFAGARLTARSDRFVSRHWLIAPAAPQGLSHSAEAFQRAVAWADFPVQPSVRRAVETAAAGDPDAPLVIGTIDTDGRLHGRFGLLPGVPNIPTSEFVPRARLGLDLVLWKNRVLVRKDYRGDRQKLAAELHALLHASGKLRVPAVCHVDEEKTLLYKEWIPGPTLRDVLVKAGARIRLQETAEDPELAGLGDRERIEAVWERGRDALSRCLPDSVLQGLTEQLAIAHRLGILGISWTYGNVVLREETEEPWLIDLDRARVARDLSSVEFQKLRDLEREQFNHLYGTELLTEKTARAGLLAIERSLGGWYSPIDFGGGLAVGSFWSTDSGTGRWEYFNRSALHSLLQGARVLDLGCHTGVLSVEMLRDGAREVLGVELSPEVVKAAERLRAIFEWRDQRSYAFTVHQGSMAEVLRNDWGRFDVVTAFCSLYYLDPSEMAAVVRHVSTIAPILVLQAKTDTRAEAAEHKAAKSSVAFLRALLEQNGFPNIEIIQQSGFSRPLLIGRTQPNTILS